MKLTLPSVSAESNPPSPVPVVPVAPVRANATSPATQYLLVCEATASNLSDGVWRFTLETADGTPVFSAEDNELGDLNRLTLLAAVRGLEAIEGASSVTLISNNRYLIRSLSDSLPRWRQNDFTWEHFGHRVDVQHADLWRRIDRALEIHRVEACLVSTRLISTGQNTQADDDRIVRVDSAHQNAHEGTPSAVPAPKRRRGHRPPATNRQPAEVANTAPSDRLRSWLMGGLSPSEELPPKRRFTSEDLLEPA